MRPPPEIRNEHGESLAYSFVPGQRDRRDIVVIGHGVTSNKDRPWSEALSLALRAQGVASLRIAFSGNGDSEGSFADSNISKAVADLGSVLDALDGWNVSYVGHSMGGATGALRAAQDTRIQTLVSLAAITHCEEFVDRMFGMLEPGELMLGKARCPFSLRLREDLHAIGSTLQHLPAIRVPWLLVHGTADDIVPVGDSRDAHGANRSRSTLIELEGVDHSFTGEGLESLIHVVVPWLLSNVSNGQGQRE
jgi:pimeloyl-ACP methyl ester carboxylesterase